MLLVLLVEIDAENRHHGRHMNKTHPYNGSLVSNHTHHKLRGHHWKKNHTHHFNRTHLGHHWNGTFGYNHTNGTFHHEKPHGWFKNAWNSFKRLFNHQG